MTTLIKSETQEIIKLHEGIASSMRRSVSDAIRIGELLTGAKEKLDHGMFIPYIERELEPHGIAQRTAYRYMGLFANNDKIATVANLQEAYRKVEQLESEAAQKERERKDRLIDEKARTGTKPAGWDRSVDYEEKKRADDAAYEARKQEAFKAKERPAEQPELHEEPQRERPRDPIVEMLEKWLAMHPAQDEDLELSDMKANARQGRIMQVIDEYVRSFPDVSRRLEAVHNLMFYLRRLGNKLQTESVT